MAYADYVFYKLTYKGSLSEAAFDSYSERASDYIDSRTEYIFRSSSIPDELMDRIKRACMTIYILYKTTIHHDFYSANTIFD